MKTLTLAHAAVQSAIPAPHLADPLPWDDDDQIGLGPDPDDADAEPATWPDWTDLVVPGPVTQIDFARLVGTAGYAAGLAGLPCPTFPGQVAQLHASFAFDHGRQRAACEYGARVADEWQTFEYPEDLDLDYRPEFEAGWIKRRDQRWAERAGRLNLVVRQLGGYLTDADAWPNGVD